MKVKIMSESGKLPEYSTDGAAGMDVRAYVKDDIILAPGERVLVPTGLRAELPAGTEAQIRARSGLAMRNGICLANGVGTIDSDYRGEIKIALINLGEEDFIIHNGDRIAQIVIARYEKAEWELTDELSETDRASGGFGHTGLSGEK